MAIRFGHPRLPPSPGRCGVRSGWWCKQMEQSEIMKTKTMLLLVLLLGVFLGQKAQAFYNPSTGRWLSRDPITELGFLLQQTGRQLFQGSKSDSPPVGVEDDDPDINQLLVGPGGLNAYGFNGNNAIIFVDYLGLAPFCVCVRAAGDHAWIVVTDLATGEVHSYGRYLLYFGKPRANHSGVHKDMASDRTRKYDAQRCVTVQSFTPTVDNGYDTLNNNCVTYAASEWKRASGESFSIRNTGWGHPDYDDPEKLVNAINKANAGKKKNEDCCGKAPK